MYGLDLLKPLIENSSNAWGTGDAAREKVREDNRWDYNQNEFTGIQNRVEGAKAAGLHPLAALGFQAGSTPSIPVGADWSGVSLSRGSGAGRQQENPAVDEEMRQAQLRRLNAESSELETRALDRSTRTLATQPGNPRPIVTDPDNLIQGQGLRSGITVEPSRITAGKGGFQAGTHQGAQTVRIPYGDKGGTARMAVPGSELSQGLEDLDILKTMITIAMNSRGIMNFFGEDIPWSMGTSRKQLQQRIESPQFRKATSGQPQTSRGRRY